jgi:ABC-type transport system involved in multi-copper enzyme maturation permease subunit
MRSGGVFVDPVPAMTEVRMVVGTAALLAVAAVLALGVGAVLRHGAVAVTVLIVAFVLSYFFASLLPLLPTPAADWILRVTPAAGLAIQQAYPQYQQVAASYTPQEGYYPLAPWTGFAVLCAWAALSLAAAAYLLNRTDA